MPAAANHVGSAAVSAADRPQFGLAADPFLPYPAAVDVRPAHSQQVAAIVDVGPRIEQRLRDGVQRCLELVATGAFDAAFERVAIDMTGTGLEALSDDAAIDAWLMATVGDTGHICGTCRMGAPDDPRAVVDPQGRVLGLEGLWVADASVFPEVPRANTTLPTIAAAERLLGPHPRPPERGAADEDRARRRLAA